MLRYLLSVDSHGVVTCALDFMKTLLDCLKDNLFTILYMKIMLDKVEAISLQKVKPHTYIFKYNLICSYSSSHWTILCVPILTISLLTSSTVFQKTTRTSWVSMQIFKLSFCILSSTFVIAGPYKLARSVREILKNN